MCNISTVQQKKVTIGVCEITKCIGRYFISTQKNIVFLKNLHSWQEFYTTVGQILTLYLVFSKIWKNTRQKCDAGRGKVLQNLLPDSFFCKSY